MCKSEEFGWSLFAFSTGSMLINLTKQNSTQSQH